jgi:hypothetical protein
VFDKLRDLFLLAESYLEQNELDKCQEVYAKIQSLAPGEFESNENLRILKGVSAYEQALEYKRRGDDLVAGSSSAALPLGFTTA